jgi:mannose-6-phosphate isomerase
VSIGESWDLADLDAGITPVPDPVTHVVGGPWHGTSLHRLVEEAPEALLGPGLAGAERFPLLVKHLDAREHLSVQVHPTPAVAARRAGSHLKTESWVVVDAEPGAGLLLGLRPGTTPAALAATLGSPALVPLLRYVPAVVGDVHHVPAGLIHALGSGVVVAEVQTPSDTTYRLYDWTLEYGRAPRDLHTEEAMESVLDAWEANHHPVEPARHDGVVVDTEHYRIARHRRPEGGRLVVPARATARVLLVLAGEIGGQDVAAPVRHGGLLLLPAAYEGGVRLAPGTCWLDVDLVASATGSAG